MLSFQLIAVFLCLDSRNILTKFSEAFDCLLLCGKWWPNLQLTICLSSSLCYSCFSSSLGRESSSDSWMVAVILKVPFPGRRIENLSIWLCLFHVTLLSSTNSFISSWWILREKSFQFYLQTFQHGASLSWSLTVYCWYLISSIVQGFTKWVWSMPLRIENNFPEGICVCTAF